MKNGRSIRHEKAEQRVLLENAISDALSKAAAAAGAFDPHGLSKLIPRNQLLITNGTVYGAVAAVSKFKQERPHFFK